MVSCPEDTRDRRGPARQGAARRRAEAGGGRERGGPHGLEARVRKALQKAAKERTKLSTKC